MNLTPPLLQTTAISMWYPSARCEVSGMGAELKPSKWDTKNLRVDVSLSSIGTPRREQYSFIPRLMWLEDLKDIAVTAISFYKGRAQKSGL